MKKITLLVLLLLTVFTGNSQCIFTVQTPKNPIVSNNSGELQNISTFAFAKNFAVVNNLIVGGKYTFNCKINQTSDGYLTITNENNEVIATGNAPLTVNSVTSSNVRIHYSENSNCANNFNTLSLNFQFIPPTCASSTQVAVSNITTNGATFNWTAGQGVTKWEVLVLKKGSEIPTPSTEGIPVNDTPTYTRNDLDDSSQYKFYVRSKCDAELGLWIGLDFSTKCITITEFDENFDNTILGGLPLCWSSIIEGTTISPQAYIGTQNFDTYENSSQALQIFKFTSSADSQFILVTPELNTLPTSKYRIKFFAHSNGDASIEVGTLNNNTTTATFSTFSTFELSKDYTEYTVDFTKENITDTYVGIRIKTGTSVFIENVRWIKATSCQDVINVSAQNITNDSARISWEVGGNEDQWDLVYEKTSEENGPNGLTPISTEINATPQLDLTELMENTDYKVWVRSVCNGIDSKGDWIGPLYFKTDCGGIEEFNENFDAVNEPTLPLCWSAIISGENVSLNAKVKTSSINPYSGTNAVELFTSSSGDNSTIMLVSPNLSSLKSATHRLRFYARSNTDALLEIGTLNGFNNNATFTAKGAPIQLTKNYQEYTIDFSDYYQDDKHIGFKNVSYGTQNTISLDDIRWDLIPTCTDVTAVISTNISSSSANVNWQTTETSSQVAYGEIDINDGSTIISNVLTETTFTLKDLKENTIYKVWVRSVCEAGFGNWIETSFETLANCDAVSTINENFDTIAEEQLPDCWTSILSGATLDPSAYVYVVDYNANSVKNSVRLNNYTSTSTDNIILVSPSLNKITGTVLKFYAKADDTATLIIGTLNGNDNNARFKPFGDQITLTKTYQEFTIDFKDYLETDTYIGFKNASLTSYTPITLDDINLKESNLGSIAFNKTNFKFYPNPVKDVLNLSYTQNMSHIAIFNLIGQKVLESNIDSNSQQLNLSTLTKGTYLVKITSKDQINTIKIIKE